MIDTILFDVGGILVPERGQEINKAIVKNLNLNLGLNLTLEEYLLRTKDLRKKAARGEIELKQFYNAIGREIGHLTDEKDLFNLEFLLFMAHFNLYKRTSTRINQNVLNFIKELKKQGFYVPCLTNTEIEIGKFNRERGLFDCFDKAYLSTEINASKPDTEVYIKVLSDLRKKPEEVIFVDDNQKYIEEANKVGINTVEYKNLRQLKKELRKLNIRIN